MPSTPIFIFECLDSEYFVLTKELNGLRHLNAEFAELRWHLRRRLCTSEAGAAYFQAAKLLGDREVCLLKVQDDGGLECACDEPINLQSDSDQTTLSPFRRPEPPTKLLVESRCPLSPQVGDQPAPIDHRQHGAAQGFGADDLLVARESTNGIGNEADRGYGTHGPVGHEQRSRAGTKEGAGLSLLGAARHRVAGR
jgi:hypothetical protein